MSDADYYGAEEDYSDTPLSFEGPCTCDHDEDEHGFTGCEESGCECAARWEE